MNLECGPGFSVHGMRFDQVAGQLTVGQLASRTGVDHTSNGTAYLPAGQIAAWGRGIALIAETLSS